MPTLLEVLAFRGKMQNQRPWPRHIVDAEFWRTLVAGLAKGRWTLSGLWADRGCIHMALLDEGAAQAAVVSLECPDGTFPSIGRSHSPASRPERAISDLLGLEPSGSPDARPWLDHGRWGIRHPLGPATPTENNARATDYPFLPSEGENLHQVPVGPVHAGIIEPGHFRFTASGETVVRLEERLGYVHKGIESLLCGMTVASAARLAGRVSGDSTVAYSLAFARAVEAALGVEAPPRAVWLRALMAELERLANHFGDIGAICNDAAFAMMHAYCGVLRERVLRAAQGCFGHRLMMDRVVPGGVDLVSPDVEPLRGLLRTIRRAFPGLVELYDDTASLQDRTVGTGFVDPALARHYGAGGVVGRASGRRFDARRHLPYPPYDGLDFDVPVLTDGDVNARIWVRVREVEQSLVLVEQILDRLPETGELRVPMPAEGGPGEGLAIVEGFRGDVLVWVRLDAELRVDRCHMRDPSCFQWPLLEAAIEGNIVADFPLCNKSFNCSYSGHDL